MRELIENPKIATGVATATSSAGMGTWFDWIPDDIGKLATLVGVVLTAILIITHLVQLKKERAQMKKALLELEQLQDKEKKRLQDKLADAVH